MAATKEVSGRSPCYRFVVNTLLRSLALPFFLSTTAFAQGAVMAGSPPPLAEVVTALNAPAGAVATANEMLASEMSQLASCLTGDEQGPWLFRLGLRSGRVHDAELLSSGPGTGTAEATTLTSCIEGVLRTLRFRQLGRSIEVRVSKQRTFGFGGLGGLGLRGTGRGGQGTIGLGSLGTIGGTARSMRASPAVRPGRANVRGGLSRELIRRVVRRHRNEVRFCYEQALTQTPTLQGRVSIRFIISGTGAISSSAVDQVDAGLETVATCIAHATRRWLFPAPANAGVVTVTYPFVLSPS